MLLPMNLSELKLLIKQLTELYFTGATVTYAKQSFAAKPVNPLVTLTTGAVSRPMNPPVKIIDGRPVCFYPASVPIQIDLFTHGRQTEVAPGITPIVENTAEDDMLAFTAFLNSEYAVQWCHKRDIAIVVPATVQDLTGLIHDTNYEFRAMAEIVVYFTMAAIGYTGSLTPESVKHTGAGGEEISGGDIQADDVTALKPEISQTPSGGGNSEMTGDEDGYFTNVSINDKLVKEENNL